MARKANLNDAARATAVRRGAPRVARTGFTFPELAVVLAVIVCLLSTAAPFLLQQWEKARQNQCRDKLKALGLAMSRYVQESGHFPSGQAALTFKQDKVGRYADPEEPRASGGGKASGASWVVPILGQLGHTDLQQQWKSGESVSANAQLAQTELAGLYCPSRRGSMSAGKYAACERVVESWRGGGNDYAACSGSGISFSDEARQTYALTNSQVTATVRGGESLFSASPDQRGIFGVNSRTTQQDISEADGMAWVILVAERRVFTTSAPSAQRSSDGWAYGGPATLFSTRFAPHSGLHYSEAGSEHPGLVQVCMADSRVRPINWNIDLRTWHNLGNYSEGSPITHPAFLR